MADSKITALASIGTGTDPANDPLVIVDVSDILPGGMSLTGTTKKVTLNNLLACSPTATLASATITGNSTIGGSLGVTGALTSYTGQVPSAIRAAASDYAAVAFDGTTTSTRITSTLTGQNIGTGDFSVWCRFRVPASVGASNRGLISLTSNATSTAQPESVHLFMASNAGELALRIYGATSSDLRQATVNGFLAAYTGQVVDAVITRTGATLKVYINGVDTAYVESTGGTPPAWSATVTSGFCNVGYGIGVQVFTGRIYRSVIFNRALSASDVTELITTGVNPADQWGTQTGQTSGTLVASKRYRITTYVSADSFTNVGAASNATGVEFVATGTTPTTWSNASTLNRIGGLVDLDFTVGGGTVAYDRSTNGLDGTLFGGVSWTMPRDGQYINGPSTITGDLRIVSGNVGIGVTPAGTGGCLQLKSGITFPATQVASSDPNTLDDYEEGSWTGTLKGSVTDPTIPVTATGRYTKIGRQVFVQIEFLNFSNVGAAGHITVTGLPFSGAGGGACVGIPFMNKVGTYTGNPVSYLNATTIELYAITSNSQESTITHNAGTGRYMTLSITYTV